jgi:hypothetical protein
MTADHAVRDLMQSFTAPPSRLAFVWLVCVLTLQDTACARVSSSVQGAHCARAPRMLCEVHDSVAVET